MEEHHPGGDGVWAKARLVSDLLYVRSWPQRRFPSPHGILCSENSLWVFKLVFRKDGGRVETADTWRGGQFRCWFTALE